MITVTGDAKILMGGQDVTEIVTDKNTVSVEGIGCKIEVCEHESDGNATALLCNSPIYQFKCKKCGAYYR